jgi:UDP-GlcNAc:undecaprenyl-phosphate GlcNAc-1-phosphate transferase
VAFLIAFATTLALTPLVARVARRLGVLDRPAALKVQEHPVPYLGGVAVLIGTGLALMLASPCPELVLPLVPALALGVADDTRPLTPRFRLLAEAGVGALAGVVIGGPVGVRIATALLVVALLNAVNLLDGLDGLASGVCLASAACFALLGGEARYAALALAGGLAAFLLFNRPPARIYLGDGGAYVAGTALALLPALTPHATASLAVWAAVPLLVCVPIADMTIAIVRRLRARRPVFAGDRSHVYDQLVDRGMAVPVVALACACSQLVVGGGGLLVASLDTTAAIVLSALSCVVIAAGALAFGFVSSTDSEGAA